MLVEKAVALVQRVVKASAGTLSSYVMNAPHSAGQPYPQQADAQALITPARMREVVMKTPTCAGGVNAILDYATGVNIHVRSLDATKKPPTAVVRHVETLLRKPNTQDTQRTFLFKLFRDLATLGYAGIEIERNAVGGVANLWVLDAARLKVDYDEHGTILGYDMMDAHGVPIAGKDGVHAWTPKDVIWLQRNPQSNSVYPSSQISQLFTAAVLEDYMLAFIGGRFNDSNVPFGIYDMGDITQQELQKAITNWNAQAQSQHRIMLTGSRSGGKWTPFGYHLKDLEAPKLLELIRTTIMGVLGITENELGQTNQQSKSNGFNLSYTFKTRAILPLLYELCETLTTRLLWDNLGYDQVELYCEEIDSRDELLQGQIDDLYHKMGVLSTNDIRNRKGQPSEDGGDIPMVYTGAAWVPVNMVNDFALAQLYALLGMDALAAQKAIRVLVKEDTSALDTFPHLAPLADANLKPPALAAPGGALAQQPGASQANKPLKPDTGLPKKEAPQKPRGPTQTLRNQGARKEDMLGKKAKQTDDDEASGEE